MNEVNILGIDLGTTNSAIAIWEPDTGQARVLHNGEGDRLTPSVVMFDPSTDQHIVGKSALSCITSHPSQVIYSVKRFIGCTFRDERVRNDQTQVTYSIEEFQQSKVAVRVGEQLLTPPEISAEVLRKLKEDAEIVLGKTISQAVITVPAYFSESQRQATKEAGELAGLRVPRIINEPTAAALAFGLGAQRQTVAVYDLGGGTFDISILGIERGLFRVKATLTICDATLEKAGLKPADIDQVLLVGGQTRLPAVKAALRDRYGWTINDSVNPDEAVARGAAVLGARLCGYLKEEVKLWDVTPLSLGIELANGKMDVIIPANNPIPVTKWRKGPQAFTTQRDGQESIRFRIYQGERPIAADNEFVGEVVLNLATTRPAGEVRVNCMFKVDHDGILHVLAEDASTEGEPVEKTFDRFYRLTPQEVEQKLKEALVHRDEDTITSRLFQLEEELTRLRRVINKEKTSDTLLLENLDNLELSIQDRNVTQAEELLAEIKSKL